MSARLIVSFVLLCLIWLAWSGLTLEWSAADGSMKVNGMLLGLGIGSCLLVTWLSQRLRVLDSEAQPFHLGWQVLAFLPWLAREVWKANVAVARVILSPRIRLKPTLLRVKASQRSSIGQVIHANTITLTPGTITLDLRDGELLVHALTDSLASEQDSQVVDARVTRVEGRAKSAAGGTPP